MIIDHRIYATILGLGLPGLFLICSAGMATLGNNRAQRILLRAVMADAIVCALTGACLFIDWLWS